MQILDQHPEAKQRVIDDDTIALERAWDVLGQYIRYPRSTNKRLVEKLSLERAQDMFEKYVWPSKKRVIEYDDTPTPSNKLVKITHNSDVYMGIVNAIGKLWDVHDFKDWPVGKDLPYPRTGINFALDHDLQEEWFVDPLKLQEGVNIISFYYHNEDTTTIHHSFVYKQGDRCILIDSWNGKAEIVPGPYARKEVDGYHTFYYDSHGKLMREDLNRPLMMREYPCNTFESFLNTMSIPVSSKKIQIMIDIFLGYKKAGRDTYVELNVCILKQSKLNQVIEEAFLENDYLFGGKRKTKGKRSKRKTRRY